MGNLKAYILLFALLMLGACTPDPDLSGDASTDVHKGKITVRGVVLDGQGQKLEGVVVSDCFKCVKTDDNGAFELDSDLDAAQFVYVSIPSGYSVPTKNGLPVFYKRLSEEPMADGCYFLEFILDEVKGESDRYSLMMVGDPQPRTRGKAHDRVAYHSLDCCLDLYCDMRETGAAIRKDRPCYAVVLGDIVHEDMTLFDEYIKEGTSKMGFPVFNVIGNHDHDLKATTDVEGARVFEEKFGPSNYSFNLGKIHYIVVDNMIMKESENGLNGESAGLRDDIMAWLKSDLSFVDKSTTIMICSHCPMFMYEESDRYKSAKNGSSYASLLSGYKKVHAWAGHTHGMFNYVYDDATSLRNIEAHTVSRATGELWTNEYLSCGVPRGYVVVDVDGDQVTWKYKPTVYQTGTPYSDTPEYECRRWTYNEEGVAVMNHDGSVLDDSYQMNVYARGAYGDNYVYANVFMWDQAWSTPIYVSSDGVEQKMTRVLDSKMRYDVGQREIYDFYSVHSATFQSYGTYSWSGNFAHRLFRVFSDKKTDCGIVKVTDRFGNTYTSEVSW